MRKIISHQLRKVITLAKEKPEDVPKTKGKTKVSDKVSGEKTELLLSCAEEAVTGQKFIIDGPSYVDIKDGKIRVCTYSPVEVNTSEPSYFAFLLKSSDGNFVSVYALDANQAREISCLKNIESVHKGDVDPYVTEPFISSLWEMGA